MLDPMEVAECVVDYALKSRANVRLYMTPSNRALLLLPGEHSKRIFWSSLVGTYNADCPPIYIVADIIDEIVRKQTMYKTEMLGERRRDRGVPVPRVGGGGGGAGR